MVIPKNRFNIVLLPEPLTPIIAFSSFKFKCKLFWWI